MDTGLAQGLSDLQRRLEQLVADYEGPRRIHWPLLAPKKTPPVDAATSTSLCRMSLARVETTT